MIGLLCLIFLALTIFSIVQGCRGKWDEDGLAWMMAISSFFFIVFAAWSIALAIGLGTGYTIDEKIAMYEDENENIEENIDSIVKHYMEFEAETYEKFQDDDAMNVISLFPELKSDTLVQKQIEVYASNNDAIKKLKEEKIDLAKKKWMLYFGR